MSETRIIKKYPNRRLYDTVISSYITLDDAKRLIVEGLDVHVIDARTKEDITHNTLLQILVAQEEQQAPLFTNADLQYLIRSYGTTRQSALSHLLSQRLEVSETSVPQIKAEEPTRWGMRTESSTQRQIEYEDESI